MRGTWVVTFLIFIAIVSDCACAVTDFKMTMLVDKLNGFIPRGGYIDEFTAPDAVLCASRCNTIPDCSAFSYDNSGNQCQLHKTTSTSPNGMRSSPTSRYYRYGLPACEEHWERFEDSCYYFGNAVLPYLTARAFCANMSSHLVQVDSKTENAFLKIKMATYGAGGGGGYWNDLFEVTSNGQERWRTSNDPLDTQHWLGGNPDDFFGKESCSYFMESASFAWADTPCVNEVRADRSPEAEFRPLCEKTL